MACLQSIASRQRVLEHSHASDRGRVPLGGATLSLLLGHGSPAGGASDSTGHHAVLPSSCTPKQTFLDIQVPLRGVTVLRRPNT